MILYRGFNFRQKKVFLLKTCLATILCVGFVLAVMPGRSGLFKDTFFSSGFVHSEPIVCKGCFNYEPKYSLGNVDLCRDGDVFLLILVTSRPDNVTHRAAIRETWGAPATVQERAIKLVFLTGITNDTSVQEQLLAENAKYNDIVQGDFYDTYRNLTYKSIMGLKWAMKTCRKAEFLLKTDDDTFVNLERVVAYLGTLDATEEFVGGNCFTSPPIRDKSSKWFVRKDEYSALFYPMYCNGFSYVMSMVTVERLVNVQPNVPFIYIEDVYITGMCRNALKIPWRNLPSFVPDAVRLRACDYIYYVSTAHYVNETMLYALHARVKDENFVRECVERRRVLIHPVVLCTVLAALALAFYAVFKHAGLMSASSFPASGEGSGKPEPRHQTYHRVAK